MSRKRDFSDLEDRGDDGRAMELMLAEYRNGEMTTEMQSLIHSEYKTWQILLQMALFASDARMVDCIIKHGPHLDGLNSPWTWEAGYLAVQRDISFLEALLKNGADPNVIHRGTSHAWCPVASIEATELLLRFGLDVNFIATSTMTHRTTALHIAITSSRLDIVRMLVQAGADISIPAVLQNPENGSNITASMYQFVQTVGKKSEQMLEAVIPRWSPSRHHLLPREIRQVLRLTLLIAQRNRWNLPQEMLYLLLETITAQEIWLMNSSERHKVMNKEAGG